MHCWAIPSQNCDSLQNHPVRTWMEEPRATPMARSILSLTATNTAVMCSHALPAMGSTISPRKACPSPLLSATSSRAPVRNLHKFHPFQSLSEHQDYT